MIIKLKSNIIHFTNERLEKYPSPQYDKFVKALDYAKENYNEEDGLVIAFNFCKEENKFIPIYEECNHISMETIDKYLKILNEL